MKVETVSLSRQHISSFYQVYINIKKFQIRVTKIIAYFKCLYVTNVTFIKRQNMQFFTFYLVATYENMNYSALSVLMFIKGPQFKAVSVLCKERYGLIGIWHLQFKCECYSVSCGSLAIWLWQALAGRTSQRNRSYKEIPDCGPSPWHKLWRKRIKGFKIYHLYKCFSRLSSHPSTWR